ncbi:hypothetical protein FRACYDRAFT_251542 [Fragilariopsis cylindrus CCMP1102]|uniref:Uncharacterized protein n=1 Tax=Fragilariopsis cylindrus CCMP1102 TaxID=635003 RepID=A0A1E7EMT1_9STRA|nr:hypothetical protein FRACYDRAFT_251542 [Fragilariopsis cylindrus CCMP1102]|eukprot:OEU07205.1 hypothetical protein FRACYDRAFT_251542 [Fragilariopsis cylindrus CCMP1102]
MKICPDMPHAIRQIGQFMNIINNDNVNENGIDNDNDDNDSLIAIIGSMTTKEYMSNYMSKFDEPYERACQLNRSADLSQLAPGNKIATKVQQKHHHPQTFNEEAQQFLINKWKESLTPLGYNNYNDDFCTTIRNRNKHLFG